jgi:hypothetical protein
VGHGELTGNLPAMPAKTKSIDMDSEFEIACGDEVPALKMMA